MHYLLIVFLFWTGLIGFSLGDEYCVTPACVTAAASILNSMDQSADPCTDFYQYACGGWTKSKPLPDGKVQWNNFVELGQKNQLVMRNVLEDENYIVDSVAEEKARAYYFSCLDKNQTVEALGSQPMIDLIQKIGGWNITGIFNVSQWNFQRTLETVQNYFNLGGLFKWGVGTDRKNSSRYSLMLFQGGLNLPSRDFYLSKGKDDKVLSAYLSFMTEVGVLLGGEKQSTKDQMKKVLDFETKLANITLSEEDLGDSEQQYNKFTLKELGELAPVIEWTDFFNSAFEQIGRDITPEQELIVNSPMFIRHMSELVNQYLSTKDGKNTLNNYLVWHSVKQLVALLSKPFREAGRTFNKVLTGAEGENSKWRSCVDETLAKMGSALSAMFVRETFKGDSKKEAEDMINEIRVAFIKNLHHLSWMDPETRDLAEEKVEAINDLIGFPDYILDPMQLDGQYEELDFKEDEYFQNNIVFSQHSLQGIMLALDEPKYKDGWPVAPAVVNAFYTPSTNNIVFPAGILQPPFYDSKYPKYLNFAAIGMVMGHELSHSLDDTGRQFDKDGNLKKWWKNRTIEEFKERSQCFIDQYSSYMINGENINGRNTLGENIADNGGIKSAFHAYQEWVSKNGKELPLPAVSLNNNQLFFIGFAQMWCSIITPEGQHLEILKDPHTPEKYRVIGTLSNTEDFSKEFSCSDQSAMNPTKKCELW